MLPLSPVKYTRDQRLGQVRLGQVRLGQVRLGQVRLGQVRLGQVRLGQVRLGQVRLGQVWRQTLLADFQLTVVLYDHYPSLTTSLARFARLSADYSSTSVTAYNECDAAGDAQNFLSDIKSTRLRMTDSARRLNPRRQDPSIRQPSSNTTHFCLRKTTNSNGYSGRHFCQTPYQQS